MSNPTAINASDAELNYNHPLYRTWLNMLARCYNESYHNHHRYGGRGITVCPRWHVFANFAADMSDGYRRGLSLDRIDNDAGYSPENCRWATAAEQARNTSRTVRVVVGDMTLCLKDAAKLMGTTPKTLKRRLSKSAITVRLAA